MNNCFIFSILFLLLMMAGFSEAGDRERNSRRQNERMLHKPVQTASTPPVVSLDTLQSGSHDALVPKEPQSQQPVSFVISTVSFDSQPAVEEITDKSMEQPVETEVLPLLDIPEEQSVEEITAAPEKTDAASSEPSIAIGYYSEQTAEVKIEVEVQ